MLTQWRCHCLFFCTFFQNADKAQIYVNREFYAEADAGVPTRLDFPEHGFLLQSTYAVQFSSTPWLMNFEFGTSL
jgi:hypothetical protein